MKTTARTTVTDTILAIDLSKHKSVACVNPSHSDDDSLSLDRESESGVLGRGWPKRSTSGLRSNLLTQQSLDFLPE